jgi:hypothetical protein
MLSGNSLLVPTIESVVDSVNISTNQDWTVENIPDWLEVTPVSGSGDGTITVTFKKNEGLSRKGEFIIVKRDYTAVTYDTIHVAQYGVYVAEQQGKFVDKAVPANPVWDITPSFGAEGILYYEYTATAKGIVKVSDAVAPAAANTVKYYVYNDPAKTGTDNCVTLYGSGSFLAEQDVTYYIIGALQSAKENVQGQEAAIESQTVVSISAGASFKTNISSLPHTGDEEIFVQNSVHAFQGDPTWGPIGPYAAASGFVYYKLTSTANGVITVSDLVHPTPSESMVNYMFFTAEEGDGVNWGSLVLDSYGSGGLYVPTAGVTYYVVGVLSTWEPRVTENISELKTQVSFENKSFTNVTSFPFTEDAGSFVSKGLSVPNWTLVSWGYSPLLFYVVAPTKDGIVTVSDLQDPGDNSHVNYIVHPNLDAAMYYGEQLADIYGKGMFTVEAGKIYYVVGVAQTWNAGVTPEGIDVQTQFTHNPFVSVTSFPYEETLSQFTDNAAIVIDPSWSIYQWGYGQPLLYAVTSPTDAFITVSDLQGHVNYTVFPSLSAAKSYDFGAIIADMEGTGKFVAEAGKTYYITGLAMNWHGYNYDDTDVQTQITYERLDLPVAQGTYAVLPTSYRDRNGAINTAYFESPRNVEIKFERIEGSDYVYSISDGWGGLYEYGAGYGSSFRSKLYLKYDGSNFSFIDVDQAYRDNPPGGWSGYIWEDAYGTANASAQTIDLVTKWNGDIFYLFLQKN